MRKVGAVGLLAALVASIFVASAVAALPKPWQWGPNKVAGRLIGAPPIVDADIATVRCTPQGRGVAGRFSRFTCEARWIRREVADGVHVSTLVVRIRPIGRGRVCVVTTTSSAGEIVAVPYAPNTEGTRIKAERACPTRSHRISPNASYRARRGQDTLGDGGKGPRSLPFPPSSTRLDHPMTVERALSDLFTLPLR